MNNAEKKIKELECQKNALQQSNALIEDELRHAEQINYELEQQLAAKPKYTPEQIEAVKDFDAWLSLNNWAIHSPLCIEHWLKEVGND